MELSNWLLTGRQPVFTAVWNSTGSLGPSDWLLGWSQVIAGFGTIILTAFLVVLYKRQQEQLAAEHEAILDVVDIEWDGDEATIRLSNYGNGVAKNIGLTTLVHVNTGEHRWYTAKTNKMKRQDKSGEWSSIIQPGEEEILFTGKSKVGEYFSGWGFRGISFSAFVRRVQKNEEATEIKFLHIVQGTELSGERCLDQVYWTTWSIDPQEFGVEHSLENLPGHGQLTNDVTFAPYLYSTISMKYWNTIYIGGVRLLNWLIPKKKLKPRPLDASGRKRVKRVAIRNKLRRGLNRIKELFR